MLEQAPAPQPVNFASLSGPVVQELDSAIHRINLCPVDSVQLVSLTLIHWIEIYPVDGAIQLLNLWSLMILLYRFQSYYTAILNPNTANMKQLSCPVLYGTFEKRASWPSIKCYLKLLFLNIKNTKIMIFRSLNPAPSDLVFLIMPQFIWSCSW